MGVLVSMKSSFLCSCFISVLITCCMMMSFIHPGFSLSTSNPRRRQLLGAENIKKDQVSLLAVKAQITHDPNSVLRSWNESLPVCRWQGVTCGRRHQRVTQLDLDSQQLAGSISPHIGNLSFLKVLHLHNNTFSGEIPPQIGQLQRLKLLRLTNNSISGQIPDNISHCSNLVYLLLGGNRLVGKIPSILGSLPKLQKMELYNNNLTGTIPPSFGNLSFLTHLLAIRNSLEGNIPESLTQMTRLEMFAVGENMLSGNVPSFLFNISTLAELDLMGNQIHGGLPSDMGNTLPNLRVIDVGFNQFISGSIPPSISNASNLAQFIVAGNSLTGQVPSLQKLNSLWEFTFYDNYLGSRKVGELSFLSDLTNSTVLGMVDISSNNFGGKLPTSLWNFSSSLVAFSVSENQLEGSIPSGIGNLVNLEILYMSDNQFTGSIPADMGKLTKLRILRLNNNRLSGVIPFSVGNLTELSILLLQSNNLQGNIPTSLEKCQKLLQLQLSGNNLNGSIPPQLLGLSSLALGLALSQNRFTGFLPTEVGNLKGLNSLDLSDNMLSGELPSSLGECQSLEVLQLQGNSFQGSIPSSLITLRGVQKLDLSRNNLSGEVPRYLEEFRLLDLNLSYNDFEGELPVGGAFRNASATSIIGNRKLCGGVAEFQLPKCNLTIKESKKSKPKITFKLVIFIVPGLVVIMLVLAFLYLLPLRKKLRKEPASRDLEKIFQVSYSAILKATDGFSSANLIGVGGFGSVYKAILDVDDGPVVVAVKVLNMLHRGASKSFIAECEAWRNIRHRNLVKIVTACSSVDFRGNDFKAIVYEFMENGSLEEWLHPTNKTEEEAQKNLSLLRRLNIAIDVASALDYLHNHCETPIVHCDLKPSNILLDNELIGHVSDFGLARFLLKPTGDIPGNQSSSIGIRGSVGYAAPEYGMGSEVSTYGDVYSFGILLLEMFTGKRPTDNIFSDGTNLHKFVKTAFPDGIIEISDSSLLFQKSTAKAQEMECLSMIFGIGLACSAESPTNRKDIGDVASELLSIRASLVG